MIIYNICCQVTTTVVIVEEAEGSKDDKPSGSADNSNLLSPEGEGKGKKRKKVKKSRSFKDTLKDKLGMTKKEKRPSEV